MKAILLAAGKGSRISKSIPPIPKCTLPVGDRPLVIRTIEMLQKRNIDIAIITGYKHEYIDDLVKSYNVTIYYNPFYDVTNSIASLYIAREFITDDDYIIMNADVFLSEEILDDFIKNKNEVVMLSDITRVDDGDYFFGTENGLIRRYGKELKREERDCEYVGLGKIDKSFIPVFKSQLIDMVSTQQHHLWWENVLYSLVEQHPIYTQDVNGKFWAEVDFIEDYNRILDYVTK